MSDLTERLQERWPELVKADVERNVGMAMELFSVEGYARMDNITPEEYIIRVLRAERERRQELDRLVRDKAMIDDEIDAAAAAGMSVVDHLTQHFNESKFNQTGHTYRAEDISAHYLRQVLQRMEERAREVSCA